MSTSEAEKTAQTPKPANKLSSYVKCGVVVATVLVVLGYSTSLCSHFQGNVKLPMISRPQEGKATQIDVHNHNIHDCHQIHKLEIDKYLPLDANADITDLGHVSTGVAVLLTGSMDEKSPKIERHAWAKTTMVTSMIDSNIDLAAEIESGVLEVHRRADNDSSSLLGGGSTPLSGGLSEGFSSTPAIEFQSSSSPNFFPPTLSQGFTSETSSTTDTTSSSETTSSSTTSSSAPPSTSSSTFDTFTSESSTPETSSTPEPSPSPSTSDTVSSTDSSSSTTSERSTVTQSSTRTSTSLPVSSSAVVSTFSTLDNGRTIVVTQTSFVSTTPTASSSNLSSGGLSNTNKIVVGVVVGVGGSIIIGIIAVLFYIKSRKKDDYQSAGWTFWRKGEKDDDDDFLNGELGVRDRNINQGSNF